MSKYIFRNSQLASGLRLVRDFHIKAQVREGRREWKEKEEREWGRRREEEEEEEGDETDFHSKRVLALVIPLLSFFSSSCATV